MPDPPQTIRTAQIASDHLRVGFADQKPRSLEELQADPGFREDAGGAVVALIPFDLPAKAVRINVSIDEHLLDAVDRAAKAAGQSRSTFLAEAARKRIMAA